MKRSKISVESLLILSFALLGFLVMGYHPGTEDDGIYLTAVKADLRPALYPHDSDFFRLQLQATVFDRWIAACVDITRIPIAWAELFWQFTCLVGIVWAALKIARHLFPDPKTHWAGVALLCAMFTLPVSGTALYILDQHLHPRTVATALILWAVTRILAGKAWQAIPLLLLAFIMHPIMAALGASFCFFLTLSSMEPVQAWLRSGKQSTVAAAAVPLGWIFEPPSPTWREALRSRSYYFLYQWTWYEWLGALGPLVLFGLLWRFAEKHGETRLARFAFAIVVYGAFQQIVAMVMLGPARLVRLTPLQPMRYLQLVYLFMALIAGCLLGRYLLKARVARWAVFLVLVNGGMLLSQRALFAGTPHLEMPWQEPGTPWLQAFQWIRDNTPEDAYFVLDPNYLAAPGEDYHSFRALAERSQLADAIKDTAVVTQVPQLGPKWDREQKAQKGWNHFTAADFEHLKSEFGVGWALTSYPAPAGLDCRWQNQVLSVCQIP